MTSMDAPRPARPPCDSGPVPGLSLLGREGEKVANTLADLAIGKASLAKLKDSRYARDGDGTLRVHIDEQSFRLLDEVPDD